MIYFFISARNLIFALQQIKKIMSEGFKELLKLAKSSGVSTYDELQDLVSHCKNEVTGADFESVRQRLKIKMF